MSLQRLYRTVSILVVFALLLNATAFLAVRPADAAPVKSEAKAPQAQGASLDIRVSVRNRDGTALPGVTIFLSAYNGSSVNQSPVVTATQTTANDGTYDWIFRSAAFTTTATIQITHTASAGYTFDQPVGALFAGSRYTMLR